VISSRGAIWWTPHLRAGRRDCDAPERSAGRPHDRVRKAPQATHLLDANSLLRESRSYASLLSREQRRTRSKMRLLARSLSEAAPGLERFNVGLVPLSQFTLGRLDGSSMLSPDLGRGRMGLMRHVDFGPVPCPRNVRETSQNDTNYHDVVSGVIAAQVAFRQLQPGSASPCQGEGRGFESRRPLQETRAFLAGLSDTGEARFQEDQKRPFDQL